LTRIVYVNGRFTGRRMTGVERVAAHLLQALRVPAGVGTPPWVLLCPPGGQPPPLHGIAVRTVGRAAVPHLWEQAVLPWAARDGVLLNLAGGAPFIARRQAAMLHDAAVYDHPEAYTSLFVAWYRALFAHLARHAERLFTVSAFSRSRLAAALGVPPTRFTVIPNGADHLDAVEPEMAALERLGLGQSRFVLAVGSRNPTKNLEALIAAWRQLAPGDPFRLVLVGGGNDRIFRPSGDREDPPGVVRCGWLPDAALKALYLRAEALVHPAIYEGFGLPPLEAMACGCPVAVARAASLPEVCGDAALYFDPHDRAAIAAAVARLLGEAPLRQELRDAGRLHARRRTWRDAAVQLRATLESLP
jgi:glycosyltransferase involved in cell wall biosynthesis